MSFLFFFSGDTATCLYNSPHEDESLPRVLPGKLLSLDAQCRRDRGTSACFVSAKFLALKILNFIILLKINCYALYIGT